MMREALRVRLRGWLGAQVAVDWEENDQGATLPRVVLSVISGAPDYALDGPVAKSVARVQIDCVAARYAEAVGVAEEVRAALSGWRAGSVAGVFIDGERDMGRSSATGEALSGVSVDVMVHYKE